MLSYKKYGLDSMRTRMLLGKASIIATTSYETYLHDQTEDCDTTEASTNVNETTGVLQPTPEANITEKKSGKSNLIKKMVLTIIVLVAWHIYFTGVIQRQYGSLAYGSVFRRFGTPEQFTWWYRRIEKKSEIGSWCIKHLINDLVSLELHEQDDEKGLNKSIGEALEHAETVSKRSDATTEVMMVPDEAVVKTASGKKQVHLRFNGNCSDICSEDNARLAYEQSQRGVQTIMMRPTLWDAGEGASNRFVSSDALLIKNDVRNFCDWLMENQYLEGAEVSVYGHSFGCHFASLATQYMTELNVNVKSLGLETPYYDTYQASRETTHIAARIVRALSYGRIMYMIPNKFVCSNENLIREILDADVPITVWESQSDDLVGKGGRYLKEKFAKIRHFKIMGADHGNQIKIDRNYMRRLDPTVKPLVETRDGPAIVEPTQTLNTASYRHQVGYRKLLPQLRTISSPS